MEADSALSNVVTTSARSVTPTDRPSDLDSAQRSAPRQWLGTAVVIAAYLLIGIVSFWPVYPGISQRLFSTSGPDFMQSIWYLGWETHALAHGLNPFFSHAMFVPTGVNLAQNDSAPLLGWITAPLAPICSPVVRANLLLLLAMPVSATAAFVVLRKWQVWGPAAALGGLVYGFSPFMVAQSIQGHLFLVFVPLPPFIALTVASILRNRGSPWRLGVQLGLLLVAQYLISPEVLATVAIMIVAAVACIAIHKPANVRKMAHDASGATGIALVIAAVLLAYPVWMSLFGPQHFTGPAFPTTNAYHTDLLSTVVPTHSQRISLGTGSAGFNLGGEVAGYIGLPVLVLAGILAWWSCRSPRMQLAVVLMVLAWLLSLGPHLAIDGHLTAVPLPFLVVDHVPVLYSILPSRIALEMYAALAAVVAFGLDDMRRVPEHSSIRQRRSMVFAAVTLVALVFTQLPRWPTPSTAQSALALPTPLTRSIPPGDPVAITYPYDLSGTSISGLNQPMLWQAEDNFAFQQLGGYAWHVLPGFSASWNLPDPMSPPSTQQLLANQEGVNVFGPETPVSPKLVAATRSVVSRYDVRVVIVDRSTPGSGAVVQLFDDALGRPMSSAGQFSMWANWHGRPSDEQFSPFLSTKVVIPTNDATLSGTTGLDAVASAYYPVSRVEFLLTGEGLHGKVIADGVPTRFGWIARWTTTSVASGTYSLQSKGYDAFGASTLSTSTTITINN